MSNVNKEATGHLLEVCTFSETAQADPNSVTLCVTKEQLRDIHRAASLWGVTMGEFVRNAVLEETYKRVESPKD